MSIYDPSEEEAGCMLLALALEQQQQHGHLALLGHHLPLSMPIPLGWFSLEMAPRLETAAAGRGTTGGFSDEVPYFGHVL